MSRYSSEMDRREAIAAMLASAAGLGLLCQGAVEAQAPVVKPAAGAKAKAVIQIWLWGGSCHIDTFDPKPEAGRDYAGPLTSPIATKTDGLRISELMPLLAPLSDKYSVIRSMTHGVNSHETASYLVQTGRRSGDRLVYPCMGAVVSLLRGYDAGYRGMIPPYVVLTKPQGRFSESGFLGPKYKPFATGGDPAAKRFAVEGVISEQITDDRQKLRRDLLHGLDSLGAAMPGNDQFAKLDQTEKAAYDLILGDGAKLFDLNQEKDDLRERYGRTTFGQSCLMARRLVESGVPYVTVNYGGWDTHKQHFETMRRKLPELDKGLSTLITDLSDRGLLDSTIVWCGGEFGRTPKIGWEAPWNGGRSHWGSVFSALVAGGGFKGGHVVGSSDARGEQVKDRPVSPQDLIGTMYQLLGIDPDSPMPNPRGLDIKLMPAAEGGGRVTELI
ncbi:MAG: DUF1501 domain-containing protein [Armatimonadetes bacterium]|nr:DUF1501 domain-containing protein [Armatimonadota bacterium]